MARTGISIGGISIGKLFTLLVVPVMYLLIGRDYQKDAAKMLAAQARPA